MADKDQRLIEEEQKSLNKLIDVMDNEILRLDKSISQNKLDRKKARENNLSETYGMLIRSNEATKINKSKLNLAHMVKDELYSWRLELSEQLEEQEPVKSELKIGLHTYMVNGEIAVCSWLRPVCQNYVMTDNATFSSTEKHGHERVYHTNYSLLKKRSVEIRFDKVKSVVQYYPLAEDESEEAIYDEFLQKLIDRRSESGFRNIVFSIQKRQGEIIQKPYKENLIVQGCAGSGKTMIMMHRLPVLLVNYEDVLSRNSIYVITPSETYQQMAEELRSQLEIEDLHMGLIEQYYNYILKKYGLSPAQYGGKSNKELPGDKEQYVFSQQFIEDIKAIIDGKLSRYELDFSDALKLLQINARPQDNKTVQSNIRDIALITGDIVRQNTAILNTYMEAAAKVVSEYNDIHNMISGRKAAILNSVTRKINSLEADISKANENVKKAEDKLAEINKQIAVLLNQQQDDPNIKSALSRLNAMKNVRQKTFENQLNHLRTLQDAHENNKELLNSINADEAYFAQLKNIDDDVLRHIAPYQNLLTGNGLEDYRQRYRIAEEKDVISSIFDNILEFITAFEEKYLEHTDSISATLLKYMDDVIALKRIRIKYLPLSEFLLYCEAYDYYQDLGKNIVDDIYAEVMDYLIGSVDKEKTATSRNGVKSVSCSPYIYTQIVYQVNGAPNAKRESLLAIDEAQNLAPVELQLLKNVNSGKCIFNLYGDVNQHIENTKGVDDWKQLSSIARFKKYNFLENYRNAKEITDYCNKYFDTEMVAVNVHGNGVHTKFEDQQEFDKQLKLLFLGSSKEGISAIILKDDSEVKSFVKKYQQYKDRFKTVTARNADIDSTKWNILTIEQAKGLEFNTVIALSGRMTRNERYICFTRALDELYVYDNPYEFKEARTKKISIAINSRGVSADSKRGHVNEHSDNCNATNKQDSVALKKTIKSSENSAVRNYFERKGLHVVDERKTGGVLWVEGSRAMLDAYVREAMHIYGISGGYAKGKAIGYKEGWYTKTEK